MKQHRSNTPSLVVRLVCLMVAFVALAAGGVPGGLGIGSLSYGADGKSAPVSVPAERQASRVAIITVEGEINQIMYESIKRRLTLAERGGADAVVFELKTPGGEVGAVNDICMAIKQSPIRNTIAWVNSDAISGGAIIAVACREIVLNDPAQIGDAMPIIVDSMMGRVQAADKTELQRKILPMLLGNVLDSARRVNESLGRYQRDELLVTAMIVNDLPLWWIRKPTGEQMAIDRREFELLFPGQSPDGPASLPSGSAPATTAPPVPEGSPASAGGVTLPGGSPKLQGVSPDAVANSIPGNSRSLRPVLTEADRGKWEYVGRVTDGTAAALFQAKDAARFGLAANVKKQGNDFVIDPIRSDLDIQHFVGAKQIRRLDRNWSEGMVVFLTNMIVRGVLLVIFIVALFVEMTHPGVSLPAGIAILALAGLLAPPVLIGMAAWWTVAAIVVGLALLGLEVFVLPGFGVAGVSGAILLFAGLVGSFVGAGGLFPDSAVERSSALWGMSTLLAGMFIAGVSIYFLAKHVESLPLLNKLVLKDAVIADDDDSTGLLQAMGDVGGSEVQVGAVGRAMTPLRPAGKIEVGERVLDAVAEIGFINAGSRVKIVSVTEFRIGVEQIHGESNA